MAKLKFEPHDITGLAQVEDPSGCMLVRLKTHPAVHSNGYVPRPRLVMENKLGRFLREDEHVYHIDFDPKNDDPANLSLKAPHKLPVLTCPICSKSFQQTNARIRYCSPKCGHVATHRCPHPSKQMLQWLVWDRPVSTLKDHFGVSDVAIAKWCKRLHIRKPGRGYWARVYAGKIEHVNPYKKPK